MEEKILIEGIFQRKKKAITWLLIIGAVAYVVGFVVALYFASGDFRFQYYDFDDIIFDFLDMYYADGDLAGVYFHYGSLAIFAVCSLFHFTMNCCSLTVTDKRVYGKATFGKRVDLPLNKISSVGLSFANSISVGTSSGRIQFWLLENSNEVHQVLSDLLISQQTTASKNGGVISSSADELKKFKDLLDSGVITQEEFDAKKKQILGL